MPTNQQRRETARRHLEKQLEQRQERESARQRFTLVASIVGTLALIAAVVVTIAVISSGGEKKKKQPAAALGATSSSVSFLGVNVAGTQDLTKAPTVTSKATTAPAKLEYKDLVVGTGQAATPKSAVSVQYVGVLYRDGTAFDSSWSTGQAAKFSLTGVVPGFTQGIGGTTGIAPMKVGGRRLMILPAALAYGAKANGPIPANSPLVFVVDLKSIDG